MTKRVLDIGNCAFDHTAIRRMLEQRFGAEVRQAHSQAQALGMLKDVDLVLVNRRMDEDDSDGMPIIEAIKSNPETAHIPVMLISNFADYQSRAEKAGAAPGFGKGEMNSPATIERLAACLGEAVR
ncbi:response regulator [Lignipirellula cremea]|uniref:Response regulator PleD n=1 Tax=Lignipirellula cremea TaxID=2528010 RepID=A0A518DZH1_9BACT|nr:response regulator [Lignipirellula cremea]QDU97211.1 response regulator PleD [Lignipirellula cremea]